MHRPSRRAELHGGVPSLRSGFRLRAQTPAKQLNFRVTDGGVMIRLDTPKQSALNCTSGSLIAESAVVRIGG